MSGVKQCICCSMGTDAPLKRPWRLRLVAGVGRALHWRDEQSVAFAYPLTIPLLGCLSLILTFSALSATAVYISVVEMLRWPRRRWT